MFEPYMLGVMQRPSEPYMMEAFDKLGLYTKREKYDPEEPEMLQMAFRAMDSKKKGYLSLEVTENIFSDRVKVMSDDDDKNYEDI